MNYIKIQFDAITDAKAEIISAVLNETNYIGTELTSEGFCIYYEEEDFKESSIREVCEHLNWVYHKGMVVKENWNTQWESNFEPIIVDERLGLRAHFHPSFSKLEHEIIITPKMSFGTGHHATTQMMLSFMLDMELTGKDVLDFGCGTGILGIFAKMKNASNVLGIDNDPWCIENAVENASLNKVEVDIELIDLNEVQNPVHLILANINLNILVETMLQLKKLLLPEADLLLSGILQTDLNTMLECMKMYELNFISKKVLGEWMAIHVKNG
jgi:ribosomal protein L11 methyltransferase